ncbi:MAG: hypothetical protein LH632_23525 [Rhodoferax sp.]|nr:hypothetical protein [Rhodoferax sp.]
MTLTQAQQQHFKKAVGQLGARLSVVAQNAIFNVNGVKIVDQGARIDLSTYERLMQHRLAVPIEESVSALPCVTSGLLRQRIESLIEETPFFNRIAGERAIRSSLVGAVAGVSMPDPGPDAVPGAGRGNAVRNRATCRGNAVVGAAAAEHSPLR